MPNKIQTVTTLNIYVPYAIDMYHFYSNDDRILKPIGFQPKAKDKIFSFHLIPFASKFID